MDRDEITGKAYDLRLMMRLWGYVRPYRRMFAYSVFYLLVSSLALLAQPYLLKIAIDRYMAAKDLAGLSEMALAINFFRIRARHSYRLIRERIARINAFLQEQISGMAIVQLFVREARTFREFDALNDSHREANHLSNMYEASLFSLVEAVS